MREIILNKTGSLKCYNLPSGLFASDFESSIKSFTPGEWAVFTNKKKGESFLGFINPLVEGGSPCAYALTKDVNLEPLHLLERCRRDLAPGGFLYLELPDGEAAMEDVDGYGREEFFVEHHHIFSMASITS